MGFHTFHQNLTEEQFKQWFVDCEIVSFPIHPIQCFKTSKTALIPEVSLLQLFVMSTCSSMGSFWTIPREKCTIENFVNACLLNVLVLGPSDSHSFFFCSCSILDIGDKYSVFRQLEQPADKKLVGKRLLFTSKSKHLHLNTHQQINYNSKYILCNPESNSFGFFTKNQNRHLGLWDGSCEKMNRHISVLVGIVWKRLV